MRRMNALPILIFAIFRMVIGYRYYSAFVAARFLALDDARTTPAHRLYDGQNYQPMNRWLLFGHHFAAIAGAGPLIGPGLAAQFGWAPGLLWLVVGVVMGGAVHDFVILAASVRRDGKSLAEIARAEVNPLARPADVHARRLRLRRLGAAGLDAPLPARLPVLLHEDRHRGRPRNRRLPGGPPDPDARLHAVRRRRRADHPGEGLPV